MRLNQAIRWTVIVLLGGYGLYELALCMGEVWAAKEHGWFALGQVALLAAIVSATFLVPAFFVYRRWYRRLVIFLSVIAALFLFTSILWLMNHFGLHDCLADLLRSTVRSSLDPLLRIFILLLLAVTTPLILLVGPFMIAVWFVRAVIRFTERYAHDAGRKTA